MQQGWGVFWRETIFVWKDAPLLPILNGWALLIPGLSPIFACRGTVVVMAAIGALFLWGITRNWWVLIFYLLNPFNFFIDRTSLMESVFVTMVLFYLWTVLRGKKFLSIAAVGLLFAAKQSALIALPFPWLLEGKLKKNTLITMGLGVFFAVLLKLTTPLWDTAQMHVSVVVDISRIKQNLWLMENWIIQYLEWPGMLVVVLGGVMAVHKRRFGVISILVLIGGVYGFTGFRLFPRYLLVMMPFMAMLVGEVAKYKWGKISIALVLLIFIHKDWMILTAPKGAAIAKEDHYQFWEDWSSGLGTKAAVDYLRGENYSGSLWVPQDLKGMWIITQLSYAPGRRWDEHFYTLAEEIGKSGWIINTSHHQIKRGELVFVSNGEARNSVRIEKIP